MRSLIVDDDFVAISKLVALLAPLGQCDAATNGQQALELFCKALRDTCPYHLVTIDINMPDISGITLLGRFQREEQARGAVRARKIMVTAASTTSNVLAAVTGECDGFLGKPVRRAVLMEKLAALGLLTSSVAQQASNCAADAETP